MDFSILNNIDQNSPLYFVVLGVIITAHLVTFLNSHIKNNKISRLEKRGAMILAKAKHIVVPIANEVGLSNADRREKAVSVLYEFLTAHGIKVRKQDLYSVVETAYKYMKAEGYLDDKQPQKTPAPEELSDEELSSLTPDLSTKEGE